MEDQQKPKRGRPRLDKSKPDPKRVYSKETSLYRNQSWKPGPYADAKLMQIRADMVRKAVSISQLADAVELTYTHLSRVLRGSVKMTGVTRQRITKTLNSNRFVESLKS